MRADQIEKSIRLIIESCNDDRIISENFESLLEIAKGPDSEFYSVITEIAGVKNLDTKYLYDGANFLLSRLHFSNNYYNVLGLRPNATSTDIKKRWRELIELYHPDRHEGKTEWVAERAKRVNEAYSTLKDYKKRKKYDGSLLQESLRQAHDKKVGSEERKERFQPREFQQGKDYKRKKLIPKDFRIFGKSFNELRLKIPRYVTVFYITAFFFFLLFIFLKYYPIDSGVSLSNPKTPARTSIVGENKPVQKPVVSVFPDLSAEKKEATSHPPPVKEPEKTEDIPIPQNDIKPLTTYHEQIKKEEPERQVPKKKSKAMSREPIRAKASTIPQTKVSSEPPSQKSLPVIITEITRSDIPAEKHNSPDPEPITLSPKIVKAEPESISGLSRVKTEIPLPNIPTVEEAKAFINDYIATYQRGDIDRFMTFFSSKASESGAIDYNGIHHIYARVFEGKQINYQITSLDIKPMEDYTLVSGIYYIDFLTLSTGEKIKSRGRINWRLIKEDGKIKMLRADYKGF
jgi:DnaJ-domain-containing protein 1